VKIVKENGNQNNDDDYEKGRSPRESIFYHVRISPELPINNRIIPIAQTYAAFPLFYLSPKKM